MRAMLEAVCFQTREVLDAMKRDAGLELKALRVDGGATKNDLLMQLQVGACLAVSCSHPGAAASACAAFAAVDQAQAGEVAPS